MPVIPHAPLARPARPALVQAPVMQATLLQAALVLAALAAGAACGGAQARRPKAGATPRATGATVAEVLDGRVATGRTVDVRGRCLGYAARGAEGPPPRTRSDWLLGAPAGGRAVYVVGAPPAGCAAMSGGGTPGAEVEVTVRGRVAMDTLPALAGRGAVRRYLVVVER
jgi:hypothetical protein